MRKKLNQLQRTLAKHSRSAAACASVMIVASCSAPPGSEFDDDGPGEFGGTLPQGAAPAPGTPGAPAAQTPANAAPGPSGAPAASASPTPAPTPSSEQPASNGTPIAPSTPPPATDNSGANNGAGGSSMVPPAGDLGAGGSSMAVGTGGAPPVEPAPPVDQQPPPVVTPPPAVTPPPVTPPPVPAGPDIPCPANATFCSGFENDALPEGSSFQSQPPVDLEFDTAVRRTGNRSLRVVSAGGFNMREVVVPIPGQSFWVRLFVQTSDIFGDNDHDSLFVASTATPSQDNNFENGPEFSEQGEQIILNANDTYYSPGGPGFPQGDGPQLSPNTWHCEEAFYDGATGDTQIFSDGAQIIDAVGFTPLTYQTFRFGYIGFNTVRTVWFDDVIVGPDRIGCD